VLGGVTTRGQVRRGDGGAVLPEFVAVTAVVTLVFAALLQLALALHVRTVLVDCIAEGARYGALADRTPADGAARARELISAALSPRFAQAVDAETGVVDGLAVVRVSAQAPLPAVGLVGTATTVEVVGHGALPLAAGP
jgi:hypothetical protein